MDSWSIILLALAGLIYLGIIVIIQAGNRILGKIRGGKVRLSVVRSAILFSLILLAMAYILDLSGDEINAGDFSIIAVFLLFSSIWALYFSHQYPAFSRVLTTLSMKRAEIRLKTQSSGWRVSPAEWETLDSMTKRLFEAEAEKLKKESVRNFKKYLNTHKREYLEQALRIIEILEKRQRNHK